MKNKSKKMYGGILQDPNDPRNNFFNFLKNSDIGILSTKSKHGFIFTLKINNPDYRSPYSMFRAKNFGEQIKTLVIKVCPLVKEKLKKTMEVTAAGREKKRSTIDEFLREYYAQMFIALDSCKYLETVCPFPIYIDFFKNRIKRDEQYFEDIPTIPDSEIRGEDSQTDFMFDDAECLDILDKKFEGIDDNEDEALDVGVIDNIVQDDDVWGSLEKRGGTRNIIRELIDKMGIFYEYLGIIAMEIAEDYQLLSDFQQDGVNSSIYDNFARFEIISLALEQRILHGDFHNKNVLIDPNYEGYFNGRTGKAMLIDFGDVTYLSDQDYDALKTLISQNNYLEAINKIYDLSINKEAGDYSSYFWFKTVTPDDINELILLTQQRQEAKQQLEEFSRQIRVEDPATKYPLIPLNLRLYQKYLPKMSYGLFFKEHSNLKGGYDDKFFEPTGDQSVINLMENVFKTMSFGINSFLNISKKIDDIKTQPKKITRATITTRATDVPKMINTQNYSNKDISVGVGFGGKKRLSTRKRKTNRKKYTLKRKYKNKKHISKRK